MDVGLVCDSCSTFNPMGMKICAHCGDSLLLDEPPISMGTDEITRVGMEMTRPAATPCPTCDSPVTVGHRFCGQCGNRMPNHPSPVASTSTAPLQRPSPRQPTRPARSTQFFGAMQATRAKLVVIRGDGMDGVSFTLAGEEHLVGRGNTPIQFEDDPFISPVHANFYYNMGTLMVRDENSTNGVYIRIKGAIPIDFGSHFLIGEQVLQVDAPPLTIGPTAIDDGTYFFASPPKPAHYRIVQTLLGGDIGLLFEARNPSVVIGREDTDIDFPNDPFISGRHAQITLEDDQLTLTDLDSKNGTFLRIDEERVLQHGDYVFMGQQLLRVEIV